MDLQTLQAVAVDLDNILKGGFINQIHQPLPREIILRIRAGGQGERKLVMSADTQMGRIHTTGLKIPNPPRPPRFCAYLRAHIKGARIRNIRCDPSDRVVTLETSYGPPDSAKTRLLILELLGRDSNIVIVDGSSGEIMDCMHRIPEKDFDNRVVVPGAMYVPPPSRPSAKSNDTATKKPLPGIYIDEKRRERLTLHADPEKDETFDSINEAASRLYESALSKRMLEAYRNEIANILRKKIKSCSKRIKNIQEDAKRLERLAEFGEQGELLKANLHTVKKGDKTAQVFDWASNAPRTVELDPALNPVENMEKMFKKAGKSKRGKTITENRLKEANNELAALEDSLYLVEMAEDQEELEIMAQELSIKEESQKRKAPKKPAKNTPARSAPKYSRFEGPVSGAIYLGKTAQGNDELLRVKAKNGDLWFHVKGAAGSHVLLTNRGPGDPDPKDIEFAAKLALEHSKVKEDSKREIIMADVKNVKKPKGAPLGQVIVEKYTTVNVGKE